MFLNISQLPTGYYNPFNFSHKMPIIFIFIVCLVISMVFYILFIKQLSNTVGYSVFYCKHLMVVLSRTRNTQASNDGLMNNIFD